MYFFCCGLATTASTWLSFQKYNSTVLWTIYILHKFHESEKSLALICDIFCVNIKSGLHLKWNSALKT